MNKKVVLIIMDGWDMDNNPREVQLQKQIHYLLIPFMKNIEIPSSLRTAKK